MAILLIKMRDSADPIKAGAKQDIWEVREDGAPLGNKECLPLYLIVKVEGKKADYLHLMEPITKPKLVFDEQLMEHRVEQEVVKVRKYQFNEASISKERMAEIEKSKDMLVDTVQTSAFSEKAVGKV